MSKIQIAGIVILIIGIVIQFALENETTDFIGTLLIGFGIGVLIAGPSRKNVS